MNSLSILPFRSARAHLSPRTSLLGGRKGIKGSERASAECQRLSNKFRAQRMKRKEKKKAEGKGKYWVQTLEGASFLIFHLLWPFFRHRSRSLSSLSIGIRNTPRRVIIFSPSAYSASFSPRPTICEGRRCGWKE